jgi:signal recognition particle subunit SRP68
LIEKTRERQTATLSEVTWRGRTVPIKSELVRVCLLTVQESSKQLLEAIDIESKLSVYETLLKELINSQQALREDLKDDAVSSYIQFLLSWKINFLFFEFSSF